MFPKWGKNKNGVLDLKNGDVPDNLLHDLPTTFLFFATLLNPDSYHKHANITMKKHPKILRLGVPEAGFDFFSTKKNH